VGRMRLPDLALLREVRPDQLYPSGFAGRALGFTQVTIQVWCRTGELESVRRPGKSGHLLIPGAALLEKAGHLIAAAAPVEYETAAERSGRAAQARADIDRIFRERKEQARARR
jgi:hypothetical protein